MKRLSVCASKMALAIAAGAFMAASPATAQRSAPIVYKTPDAPAGVGMAGQGGDVAPAQRSRIHAQVGVSQQAAPSRRIEFRYPDQPSVAYGEGGARDVQGDTPIAFSSSTAAIAPDEARQYAHLDAPSRAETPQPLDPAITSGGFDARATAARIAAQASLPAHDAAPETVEVASAAPAPEDFSLPGTVHRPAMVETYDERGLASVYSAEFIGQPTANGEIYDPAAMTAAHPSLPLPSLVQVINLDTGREVVVRVNDRGPFNEGGLIDLSERAAELLAMSARQTGNVRVRYLGPAPVAASVQHVVSSSVSGPTDVVSLELPSLAPPPAAPPSVPVQQPPAGGVYVQVGAFSSMYNAERMSASLDAALPVEIRNEEFHRVWIGPFSSRGQAELVRDDLARRGVVNGVIVTDR